MVSPAQESGAKALVRMWRDATELAENMTGAMAYGTAVVVEPA